MSKKLALPLNHYDESGRIKPPVAFWLCSLFLARSYFIFIVALSFRQDSTSLLKVFYPNQSELYVGFVIGLGAVLASILVVFREKWWQSKWDKIRYFIKPLILLTLSMDLLYQFKNALDNHWQFLWTVAIFVVVDTILLYWLLKSRHVRWMIRDWKSS